MQRRCCISNERYFSFIKKLSLCFKSHPVGGKKVLWETTLIYMSFNHLNQFDWVELSHFYICQLGSTSRAATRKARGNCFKSIILSICSYNKSQSKLKAKFTSDGEIWLGSHSQKEDKRTFTLPFFLHLKHFFYNLTIVIREVRVRWERKKGINLMLLLWYLLEIIYETFCATPEMCYILLCVQHTYKRIKILIHNCHVAVKHRCMFFSRVCWIIPCLVYGRAGG